MSILTLVLGGARSGKSAVAEELILSEVGTAPTRHIATADAIDEETHRRISDRRAQRDGAGWVTVAAPRALAEALAEAPSDAPVMIDCLTLWLHNHIVAGSDLSAEIAALEAALSARRAPVVAVAMEVGLSVEPEDPVARRLRIEAGKLNQRLAAQAERVVFVAAGLPMVLKSRNTPATPQPRPMAPDHHAPGARGS